MKSMTQRFAALTFALLALLPLVAFAQQPPPSDFRGVVEMVLRFLQMLTGAAWVVLLVSFIYGVIKFLMNFEDERAREEGKRAMVFSLVATTVALTVWGIISLLTSSFFGGVRFGIPLLTPPAAPAAATTPPF